MQKIISNFNSIDFFYWKISLNYKKQNINNFIRKKYNKNTGKKKKILNIK